MLCKVELDCGAAWVPDLVNYILYIGVILILMGTYLIGVLARYLLKAVLINYSFLEISALYYIFFAFVSLPVGNFISGSSANKLSILFITIGLIFYRYFKIKPLTYSFKISFSPLKKVIAP